MSAPRGILEGWFPDLRNNKYWHPNINAESFWGAAGGAVGGVTLIDKLYQYSH